MRWFLGLLLCGVALVHSHSLSHNSSLGMKDFTPIFKYLGTLISFDLRDDKDIEKRISKASQMVGALKNVWDDEFVDKKTKYLFFLAIPINLLMWGCETWALKESSVKAIDVFIHRSIRRILGIKMSRVKEEKITNKSVREMFYNIPDARSMIAARQLSYLGKMVRNHDDDYLPKKFLTAWVNNKRPVGGVLTTNKKALVNSLELILPPIPERPSRGMSVKRLKQLTAERKAGDLKHWIELAMDEKYWEWLIDSKLRTPHLDIPEPRRSQPQQPPPPRTPPPRRNPRRSTRPPSPQSPPPTPPPSPPQANIPPSPPPTQSNGNYNPEGVGRNINDSLGCLGLGRGASEREVRVKFIQLSRIYHPDKHDPEVTGLSHQQAKEKFQEFNNAHAYLRGAL